jgi:outer membrane lipase/esterase
VSRERALPALALLLALAPGPAAAYSDIVFFGDSLSDTGNACAGLLVVEGYEPGRCSNGAVWTEVLADALGFEAEPSSQGGFNFANGGDTSAELDLQIALYDLRTFGEADPDALHVIWLGGNDVLATPGTPGAMAGAAARIREGIEDLFDLGARHFLVANLPDVGRAFGHFGFPEGSGAAFTPGERDLITALGLEFNAELDAALATLALPGVSIRRLDVFTFVESIFADPGAFAISPAALDSTSDDTVFGIPCLQDAGCAADPQGPVADGFFLFDALHPTRAVHQRLGQRAAQRVPEPVGALGAAAALLAAGALARARGAL